MAEDRERRDAIIGRAALCARRRPRLEARRRGEGHAGAEAAGLTCGEVNQGARKSSQSARNHGLFGDMTQAAEALPDDPETLKAMLIAERQRAERLVQIIKDLQRHRFGRRAESLPDDQLLLALEDVEQGEAEAAAEAEAKSPADARGGSAQAARQPRRLAGASAAHRDDRRRRGQDLPVLQGDAASDRRGREREARRRSRPVPRAGGAPAQIRLPRLRGRRRPVAGAGAADRGRPADRGDGRPRARLQIRRSPAALSPGADLRASGRSPRPLDARRLGRTRRVPSAPRPRAHSRPSQILDEAVRRRDDGAGARSRARAHQDRPALGLCARRSALGRIGPAGGRLCLCAGPQGLPADRASRRLQGRAPGRRLRRLSRAGARRATCSLAFCWAHLRRRFYERAVSEASPIAAEALQRIAALYRIETDIRGRAPDERRAVRQERSSPLIVALHAWLRDRLALISQKSKLAEVIRYALSHWDGLARFLDDGRIEIDSNTVERSIRPIALNRKNALFAGSDGGGERPQACSVVRGQARSRPRRT